MCNRLLLLLSFSLLCCMVSSGPVVINTWPWPQASSAAWKTLVGGGSVVDAVVDGCTQCEIDQCDGSVGYGSNPDENGETTLDALVMDGKTRDAGSVGCLRRIRNAVNVARYVMEYTTHTIIVGDLATNFAIEMGFPEESLATPHSIEMWKQWKEQHCQPNYRRDVSPDPTKSCGPYKPLDPPSNLTESRKPQDSKWISRENHDTIAMIALDANGDLALGATTNGMNHKVPGRVADTSLPGAGGYIDNDVGGCGATGDGDIMMRFLPCYQAVESMRLGLSPNAAAEDALRRIGKFYPSFKGALVTMNKAGVVGGAGWGWNFSYTYQDSNTNGTLIVNVKPINP